MAALASLTPTQAQVLDYIAGPESRGRYNVINGGQTFSSYADHPRVRVPIRGGKDFSTAAGRYQMLGSTWDLEAKRLGLPDFSPENQDRAAWDLASRLYLGHTGRALDQDYQKGQVDWHALAPVWTSVVHDPAKPKPGETAAPASAPPVALPPFPGLTNTPEMEALLHPKGNPLEPGPSAQPAADAGAMSTLALQSLLPQHQFTPVDYDPWKLAPHLQPIEHDPFNPPGGAGDTNAQ